MLWCGCGCSILIVLKYTIQYIHLTGVYDSIVKNAHMFLVTVVTLSQLKAIVTTLLGQWEK